MGANDIGGNIKILGESIGDGDTNCPFGKGEINSFFHEIGASQQDVTIMGAAANYLVLKIVSPLLTIEAGGG